MIFPRSTPPQGRPVSRLGRLIPPIWINVLLLVVQPGFAQPTQPAPIELTLQNFDQFMNRVLPDSADLDWKKIRWESQLTEAILEANREDKPILIWAMNGHPLGCT